MGLLTRKKNLLSDDELTSSALLRRTKSSRLTSDNSNLDDNRIVVAVAADTSASMNNVTRQLNQCLRESMEVLKAEPTVARRVDFQLVTAGGTPKMLVEAQPILSLRIPELSVGGCTPLAKGAVMSLDGMSSHIEGLRSRELSVVSSILVVISDGEANDPASVISEAQQRLRAAQDGTTIIPLLTEGGNKIALEELCGTRCLEVSKTDISTLFRKLTYTIRVVSTTSPSKITGPGFVRNLMFEGE